MALTIALLRAVNIGGRKLAMADLRALMVELGFANAQTLIQSGNLVFDAGRRQGDAELERALEAATLERFGLQTDYLVRSAEEWGKIVANNPFSDMARDDPAHVALMPLKFAPAADRVAALQAAIIGRERLRSVGRELYITYPDGIGTSKLTNAVIERRLGVRGTARNWNTALKLAEMVKPS